MSYHQYYQPYKEIVVRTQNNHKAVIESIELRPQDGGVLGYAACSQLGSEWTATPRLVVILGSNKSYYTYSSY